jgi:hypothetical protein
MASVIEECTNEEQLLLWAKELNAKDIHKEMFLLYGGKCLSHKAVHKWVASVSLMIKTLKRRCGSD